MRAASRRDGGATPVTRRAWKGPKIIAIATASFGLDSATLRVA